MGPGSASDSSFLLIYSGRLLCLGPMWETDGVPGSYLWLGLALAIVGIQEVDQQIKALFLSACQINKLEKNRYCYVEKTEVLMIVHLAANVD